MMFMCPFCKGFGSISNRYIRDYPCPHCNNLGLIIETEAMIQIKLEIIDFVDWLFDNEIPIGMDGKYIVIGYSDAKIHTDLEEVELDLLGDIGTPMDRNTTKGILINVYQTLGERIINKLIEEARGYGRKK